MGKQEAPGRTDTSQNPRPGQTTLDRRMPGPPGNEATAAWFAEDHDFKEEVIKDILCQIDYQSAVRNNAVEMDEEELSQELRRLSTRALLSWYAAFLHIRAELMFAGYELNGFTILNRPFDAIQKLIEKDPYFDIRQYIF